MLIFNALEAVHHAVAQWFERTPRVRSDGPRHLGIIGDDYRICNHKKKKKSASCVRSSLLSCVFHAGGDVGGREAM